MFPGRLWMGPDMDGPTKHTVPLVAVLSESCRNPYLLKKFFILLLLCDKKSDVWNESGWSNGYWDGL